MKKLFAADQSLPDRLSAVEQYLENLQLHRDSRRGLDGATGPRGADSQVPGPVGPPGPAGRDADVTECVEAAKAAIEQEYGWYLNKGVLEQLISHSLKVAGVIDEEGRAILQPGPVGPAGTDSQVAGPPGRDGVDGKSIVGPPGADGKSPSIKIGSVTHGKTASASLTEVDSVFILDLTLPRGEKGQDGVSNVAGPRGEQGEIGPRGIPGVGLKKEDVVATILDMAHRGVI